MTESRLPPLAVILGAASLLPFFFCALGAVRADPVSGQMMALGLITYGSVVLAFLGGVHWGFVIEGCEETAERQRLALGTVPALIGWAASLLGLTAHPVFGIAMLIAGFIGTAVVEQHGRRSGLIPRGYMLMRWVLTGIVTLVLAAVLVLRIIGGHLMF
jgi:hypothetical protein